MIKSYFKLKQGHDNWLYVKALFESIGSSR